MKVLYLIDTLEVGGAERSLLELTPRLKHIKPIVCHLYRGDVLRSRFEAAGVPVISLNLRGPYQLLRAYRLLRDLCIKEKPDAIVSALYRSDLLARIAGRRLGIMQVGSWVSDSYAESKKATFGFFARWKYSLFYWLNLLTIQYSTAIISNSESIRQSNSKALRVPLEKVKVIYRGREILHQNERPPRYAEGKPVRYLSVGRLIKGKGLEELIRAFDDLCDNHLNAKLTIAGDGPLLKTLKEIVKECKANDKIQFTGYVEDVGELYRSHHCLVFPSHLEGISGVLIEAMLNHLPVLASDIPMNREIITHGETGFLFPVGDQQGILQTMTWYLAHARDAETMSDNAYRFACQNFDIERVAVQHEKVLLDCFQEFRTL